MDIFSSPQAYYSLSALLNLITSVVLISIVLKTNPKPLANRIFNIFMALIGFWSLFYFLWLNANDMKLADFYLKTCMIGVIFMPSVFVHFIISLLKQESKPLLKQKSNNRPLIIGNYIISALLAFTVYTPLFAKEGGPFNVFKYWAIPGPIFPLHLAHFLLNFLYSFYLILYLIKKRDDVFRSQDLYAFIGIIIGFIGGATNYLYWYRVPILPVLNIFVFIGLLHIHAITKFRLMETSG